MWKLLDFEGMFIVQTLQNQMMFHKSNLFKAITSHMVLRNAKFHHGNFAGSAYQSSSACNFFAKYSKNSFTIVLYIALHRTWPINRNMYNHMTCECCDWLLYTWMLHWLYVLLLLLVQKVKWLHLFVLYICTTVLLPVILRTQPFTLSDHLADINGESCTCMLLAHNKNSLGLKKQWSSICINVYNLYISWHVDFHFL